MKLFTIFHPLVMAFYSKALYQDVARHWKGIGALYLLMLLVITWLPMIFIGNLGVKAFIDHELPPYVAQVPIVTINNGELTVDKPVPYHIRDVETGKTVVLVDTSGKTQNLQQTSALVLVTKHEVMIRNTAKNQIRQYEFQQGIDFSFDKADVASWLQVVGKWLLIILFPLIIAVSYAYRIVQALIYGAIGLFFSAILKAKLSFQQSMRLAIIAVTPAVMLSTLFDFLGIGFPFMYVSYFALTLVYLFFAVYSNSDYGLRDEF